MAVSRPRVLIGFKDLESAGTKALEREDPVVRRPGPDLRPLQRVLHAALRVGAIDDSFSFSYNSEDAFGFSLIGAETDEPSGSPRKSCSNCTSQEGKLKPKDLERSKRKRLGSSSALRHARRRGLPHHGLRAAERGPLPGPPGDLEAHAPALERRLREHFDEQNYAVSISTRRSPEPGSGSRNYFRRTSLG